MAALFVSIFLFFLSVALVWTNRQDIALNLFMEHKLKAQSAARSGAMTVYAQLRETGQASITEKELPSGATWKVEIETAPPEGLRGRKVLVRSRGTSGLQHAYCTLHLEAVEMGTPLDGNMGRVLMFAGSEGASGPDAPGPSSSEASSTGRPSLSVTLGGGPLEKVQDNGAAPESQMGNGGVIFGATTHRGERTPFHVVDWIPVFSPDGATLMAAGPTLVVGPPSAAETEFSVLRIEDEQFRWEGLESPLELEQKLPELEGATVRNLIELQAAENAPWSGISIRGIVDSGQAWSFREPQPQARHLSEVRDLAVAGVTELAPTVPWGTGPPAPPVRYYTTHGAFTVQGKCLYSYGYEYLYRGYSGALPVTFDQLVGARLTRWPCILSYDSDRGGWAKVWGGLSEAGDVRSPIQPSFGVLLASTDGGPFYSVTKEEPRRLLTLSGDGEAKVGREVPPGVLCSYRGKPFLLSTDDSGPGLISMIDGETIDFLTLPQLLPEISGDLVVPEIGEDGLVEGLDQEQGLPVSADTTVRKTARPAYRLRYAVAPGSRAAVDDQDLWAQLQITVEKVPPTYETIGEAPYPDRQVHTALGRYDGQRWSILPHGLRALLEGEGSDLQAPNGAAQISVGRYQGLPEERARYSVISVDTRPFRPRLEAL